jgi:hypothetical protein
MRIYFPKWLGRWKKIGLAGGRRSEKQIHSIQPPFCLFFDRPIFLLFTNFEKQHVAAFCLAETVAKAS